MHPDRRAFLQAAAATALVSPKVVPQAHVATARSVLLLWLWGGPSQTDTFDPKPDAPLEFRGPFAPIATRTPGLRFGELFPKIAAISDRLSVLRSLHTGSNDHGVAGTIGLTGSRSGGASLGATLPGNPRPSLGSTVARVKGFGGKMPPFMVVGGRLHQGKKAIVGEGGGSLGGLYDPFRLEHDPETGTRVPALTLPGNLTPERLSDRRRLVEAMDGLRRQGDARAAGALNDYRTQALAMLTSPEARRAFDLGRETDATKERYGLTRFGQSCLLGRRLVESGVPFVQVNWSDHVEAEEDAGDGGWDNHYRNFQLMADRQAPWLDQAYSTLILDLQERGLLATTLVIAVGEFGRSPRVNDKAGRDHWEHCYCALVAGGGTRGGRVVGASDSKAQRPTVRPLSPADVIATVHHATGVTSEQAQTFGVAPEGGRVIEELF